ncbi:hypothetical protein B0H14DRAFT_3166950 [Mycena olivaceomarginata]|nr:hypothetical protein B0H14DRAFT_3166950 [Mycena olivaceomarginata]
MAISVPSDFWMKQLKAPFVDSSNSPPPSENRLLPVLSPSSASRLAPEPSLLSFPTLSLPLSVFASLVPFPTDPDDASCCGEPSPDPEPWRRPRTRTLSSSSRAILTRRSRVRRASPSPNKRLLLLLAALLVV